MPSVWIYNFHSHENKENSLNEKVCPNFWSVLYMTWFIRSSINGGHQPRVQSGRLSRKWSSETIVASLPNGKRVTFRISRIPLNQEWSRFLRTLLRMRLSPSSGTISRQQYVPLCVVIGCYRCDVQDGWWGTMAAKMLATPTPTVYDQQIVTPDSEIEIKLPVHDNWRSRTTRRDLKKQAQFRARWGHILLFYTVRPFSSSPERVNLTETRRLSGSVYVVMWTWLKWQWKSHFLSFISILYTVHWCHIGL